MQFSEIMGIGSIPVISIICYMISEVVKLVPLDNKWIPVINGVSGGILGIVARIVMPTFPAVDILTAIVIGIISGLGATGVHQVFKQLSD